MTDKTNRAIKICRRIEQESELAGIDVASGLTPEIKIDMALDSILKASGSALKHYTMPLNLENMRKAMRKIMSDSYISGSNDCAKALTKRYT